MQEPSEPKPYSPEASLKQWGEYEGVPMIRGFIVPDLCSAHPHWRLRETKPAATARSTDGGRAACLAGCRYLHEGEQSRPGPGDSKMMKANDPHVAESSYEVLRETLVSDPRIPAHAIRQSINLTARSDARVKNIDANKVSDMKIANRTTESGK